MAKAAQEIEDKPAAALAILEPMKAPGYLLDMRRKDLLQARGLDLSGKTAEAYSYVLACYAKHPTDEVRAAIGEYGNKLGKTSQERDAATWSAIADSSTPAIPFSLPNFTDGKFVLWRVIGDTLSLWTSGIPTAVHVESRFLFCNKSRLSMRSRA